MHDKDKMQQDMALNAELRSRIDGLTGIGGGAYLGPARDAYNIRKEGSVSLSAQYVWANQVQRLLFRPDCWTDPRGQGTTEILGSQVRVDLQFPVVTDGTRDLGYKFMAAEAYWIMSGDNRVETIKPYSKDIEKFSDDGTIFFGAYGPKFKEQLDHVCKSLIKDINSRQAVINIWRENPPETKDTPCTLSWQWLIRGEKLHCVATMRSSDVWLGLPYDIFNFSMLTWYILLKLRTYGAMDVDDANNPLARLDAGDLILTMGSSHLYERNMPQALKCSHNNFRGWDQLPVGYVLEKYKVNSADLLLEWLREVRQTGVKQWFQ